MKIRRLEVVGLNKRVNFNYDFHDDINIFTGLNGSGKTSALKLAWYLLSGSTVRIRNEIDFKFCRMVTDKFEVSLERFGGSRDIRFTFEGVNEPGEIHAGQFDEILGFDSDGDPVLDGEDNLRDLIRAVSDKSIYFPTFRRIEGGYSITSPRRGRLQFSGSFSPELGLGAQLEQISKELSVGEHKFVCSVSTEDVGTLLTQRYAQISEGVNRKYTEFSSEILQDIRAWEQGGSGRNSEKLLLQIQAAANEIDGFRDSTLKPFNVLSELVEQLFSYQGVKLRGLALGDSARAIDSDVLSAGEKQMLSFLVYNAFSTDTAIFIDEPELSLHPDWQRRLFPTLLEQQSSNQFIISTHSPFMYAKYSDKELPLNPNRGD